MDVSGAGKTRAAKRQGKHELLAFGHVLPVQKALTLCMVYAKFSPSRPHCDVGGERGESCTVFEHVWDHI